MPVNRRGFLAAGVAAGLLTHRENAVTAADQLDPTKLTKANIPTPALLVDLDAFESNVTSMAEHCRKSGRGFRPHAKTHKCPEVAKRQMAAGALGICTATVSEAEALVAAGITGVLLTSPIVEPAKIARMIALVKREKTTMLSVGHSLEIELLSQAAAAAGVDVDLLVDVDIGDRRTGILPGQPALLAIVSARQTQLKTAAATYQSAVVAAIAAAKASCSAGVAPATVRATFIASLTTARTALEAARKNIDKSTGVDALKATRKAAVDQAIADFKASVQAALVVLKAALPSPSATPDTTP